MYRGLALLYAARHYMYVCMYMNIYIYIYIYIYIGRRLFRISGYIISLYT
jgi:hypothetical protein